MEVLKVEHLNFDYSDASVLRDVTFTLKRGDFLGIIGAEPSREIHTDKTHTRYASV